jgi:uncharacterized protein
VIIDLTIPLLTGFLASFHCVGMCGPIVAGFIAQRPVSIELPGSGAGALQLVRSISSHVYYNAGRVLSYGVVGAIAGAVGAIALIDPGIQQVTSVVFGVIMIAMGLFQLDIIRKRAGKKEGLAQRIFGALTKSQRGESRFLVGMMTPLLPCGLLYGMAAQAASAGSPVTGAMTMSVFALGAIPALVLTGMAASFVSAKLRKFGTLLAALLIIVMGLLTIARGFGLTQQLLPGMRTEHLCGM